MTTDEQLVGIFRQVMNNDHLTLTDSTTAAEVEGWDSLSHVTLMFSIEQEFNIQFRGDEFSNLNNVGDLRTLIKKKVGDG
jgi:acyl carrier protein